MSLLKDPNRIHFIVPYPFNIAPGQRFRFEQYLTSLKDQGRSVFVFPFLSESTNRILYKKGNFAEKSWGVFLGFLKRFFYLPLHVKADYIFIFREATPLGPPIIEWILAKLLRKKIIYDFDDAIWLSDNINESWLFRVLKWRSKVKFICRWSYRVSCGNNYLASYARQFNTHVVYNPTTIDTQELHTPKIHHKNMDEITIGWTGSHSTLKYLLNLEPVFLQLEKTFSHVRFVIIADMAPQLNLNSVVFLPWSLDTEIADLSTIDIGVMPLPDDEWSNGKCGFKALQFMSLQIPVVVSPIGVNNIIIEHGQNGLFASSHEEWVLNLTHLILHEQQRVKLGVNGRKKVISSFSVNSNNENFLSLFTLK